MKTIIGKLNKIGIEIKEVDKLDIGHVNHVFYGVYTSTKKVENQALEIIDKKLIKENYENKRKGLYVKIDKQNKKVDTKEFYFGINKEEIKEKITTQNFLLGLALFGTR